jgi:hypothetical protein
MGTLWSTHVINGVERTTKAILESFRRATEPSFSTMPGSRYLIVEEPEHFLTISRQELR